MPRTSDESRHQKTLFKVPKKINRGKKSDKSEMQKGIHIFNIHSAPQSLLMKSKITFECDDNFVQRLFKIKDQFPIGEKKKI